MVVDIEGFRRPKHFGCMVELQRGGGMVGGRQAGGFPL